ncbi:MAG TPA: hypothetical protein DCS93_00245 [Microscillaceae bacterium]|nr:hypothetical protein [Microscillaceae bacterium]
MKTFPTYALLIAGLLLLNLQVQAQSYTKKVLEKVPELEVGKVYTGKDIRAAKKLFPEGVAIEDETVYPFAKLTGRRVVVIFYFRVQSNADFIHIDATSLRKKNLQPEHVNRYLYSHGKIGDTDYTSTFSMDKKKIVTFKQIKNGKISIKRYRIERKRFSIIVE